MSLLVLFQSSESHFPFFQKRAFSVGLDSEEAMTWENLGEEADSTGPDTVDRNSLPTSYVHGTMASNS